MIFVIFKTKNIKQIIMCIANTPSGEFLDQLQEAEQSYRALDIA